jgi:hypothetical protein
MDLYQWITNMDVHYRFIYIVIIVAAIFIAGRFKPSGYTMFGIVVALVIIYYINNSNENLDSAYFAKMERIMADPILKGKNWLYLDSEILDFLFKIRFMYAYNPGAFTNLVNQIDEFLKLTHDLETGTERYNFDYSTLKEQKGKIMNTFHAFVHSIPVGTVSTKSYEYYMRELERLLNYQIDRMHTLVVTKNNDKPIDITTAFPVKNEIKGVDPTYNASYNYFTQ